MKQHYSLAAILQSLLCFSKNKSAVTKKLILVLTAIVCISYIHAQTLIAYYPLNGNAKDSSGNHYDGAISGGVSYNTDRNGNANSAASFNGVDGRIYVLDNAAFRLASFTVSAWVYLDATPTRNKVIVAKNLCSGILESFAISIDLNGHLYGTISNGVNSAHVEYAAPGSNTWHLITMTYDYTQHYLILYLDDKGVSIVNTNIQIAYDNNSFAIGYQLENCTSNYFFHGKIDEVRYYNGALSGKQVADLYDSTKTIQKPAKLVAYYPLNGNAKDSGGNHYDGIISGGVSFVADRNGNTNSAGHFNGVDSRIDVPDNHAFRPASFTASGWFYFSTIPPDYKIIVGKNLCDGVLESFAIYLDPYTKRLRGAISDGRSSGFVASPIPALNTWHFTALTYDYSHDSLKLYLDGSLVNAISINTQIAYDNSSFSIGYELENCASNYFFHGRIDEVRLYNGALSDQQVSNLYDSTSFAVAHTNSAATGNHLFTVSVFPNPASSLLNIYINNTSAASVDTKNALNINSSINLSKATLQVIGIAGNILINKEVDAFNKQNVLQLNVSQLAPGAYFIKLISADGKEASVVKFEKQ